MLLVSKSSPPMNLLDQENLKCKVDSFLRNLLRNCADCVIFFCIFIRNWELILKVEFLGGGFLLYLFQVPVLPILQVVHRDKFLSNTENNSIRGKVAMSWDSTHNHRVLSRN